MKNVLFAVILSAALVCMPALADDDTADNNSADSALSLITANADEGFALAVTLARRAVTTTQPDKEVLFDQRPEYSTDADSLIAVSQTRSEEHTSELQSRGHLVCRLLLEKKNRQYKGKQDVVQNA